MPKEKKKGFLSLFRKKAAKEQPVPTDVTTADSFVDLNDLIPTPDIVYKRSVISVNQVDEEVVKEPANQREKEETTKEKTEKEELPKKGEEAEEKKNKVEQKTKKKARAAPPPPQERAVDVEAAAPRKPPRDPKELTVEEKKAIIRKQLSEDSEEGMITRKSSSSSVSRVVETNVLHYSPQTQHRTSTFSPEPASDVPPIERQSNIILNGTARVKSIPVSCYDGRPKHMAPPPPQLPLQTVQKQATQKAPPPSQPPPPPPTAIAAPIIPIHKRYNSADSTKNSIPRLDGPPKAVHNGRPPTKQEEDIALRYQQLKDKFDLWQMILSTDKHSAEAKKLQMELIRDHDTVMELLRNTVPGEVPKQIQKRRSSIAPDTYTPRLSMTATIRSPLTITASHSSHSVSSNSPSSSSPGTSRSVTPKTIPSSPSVSPAASIDSSESGAVRKRSDYAQTDRRTLDENGNVSKKSPQQKNSPIEQKQMAIDRIQEEARELLRKEQELKRASMPVMYFTHSRENSVEVQKPQQQQQQVPVKAPVAVSNGFSAPKHQLQSPAPNGYVSSAPKITGYSPVVPKTPTSNGKPNGSSTVVVIQNGHVRKSPTVPRKTENVPKLGHENNSPAVTPVKTVNSSAVKSTSATSSPKMNPTLRKEVTSSRTTVTSQAVKKEVPPPLPTTAVPKLPYLGRNSNEDKEAIYKVSTVKKSGTTVVTVNSEQNNNVPKKIPRSPVTEKRREEPPRERKPEVPVTSKEVTSAIKSTIATSRIEPVVEQKRVEAKESPKKETVSRSIADTVRKNIHQRPALDLSAMLDRPPLRKVSPPVERNGIAMGKVIEAPIISTPSTSSGPPPAPPPPPPMMSSLPPPPPPPPPTDFFSSPIYQAPSPVTPRPSSVPMAPAPPPPLVSSQQLNDQKQRLRTPVLGEKPASPLDLRDSLMAEIRNASGGRGLRKVNRS